MTAAAAASTRPSGARQAYTSRKALKQWTDRQRRDERELARELQERAGRGCYPARDDGAPPRID